MNSLGRFYACLDIEGTETYLQSQDDVLSPFRFIFIVSYSYRYQILTNLAILEDATFTSAPLQRTMMEVADSMFQDRLSFQRRREREEEREYG